MVVDDDYWDSLMIHYIYVANGRDNPVNRGFEGDFERGCWKQYVGE